VVQRHTRRHVRPARSALLRHCVVHGRSVARRGLCFVACLGGLPSGWTSGGATTSSTTTSSPGASRGTCRHSRACQVSVVMRLGARARLLWCVADRMSTPPQPGARTDGPPPPSTPPPPPTHTHTLRRCAVCAGRAGPAAAPLLVRRQLLQQVRCTGARPVLMLPRPGWHAGAAAHARCQRPRHACCCVTRLVTQTQTQTQTQTHTHTHTHAHTHTHNPQACHQLADGPWAAPLASALRPRLPNRP
jgi:hypothetical protein